MAEIKMKYKNQTDADSTAAKNKELEEVKVRMNQLKDE